MRGDTSACGEKHTGSLRRQQTPRVRRHSLRPPTLLPSPPTPRLTADLEAAGSAVVKCHDHAEDRPLPTTLPRLRAAPQHPLPPPPPPPADFIVQSAAALPPLPPGPRGEGGGLAAPAGHAAAHPRVSAREQAPILTPRGLGERPGGSRAELAQTSDFGPTADATLGISRLHSSPGHRAISTVPTAWPPRVSSEVRIPEVNPNLSRCRLSKPHCPQRSEPSPPPPPRGWAPGQGVMLRQHPGPVCLEGGGALGLGPLFPLPGLCGWARLGPGMLSGAPESDVCLTLLPMPFGPPPVNATWGRTLWRPALGRFGCG